jgi:hypothetical protein
VYCIDEWKGTPTCAGQKDRGGGASYERREIARCACTPWGMQASFGMTG